MKVNVINAGLDCKDADKMHLCDFCSEWFREESSNNTTPLPSTKLSVYAM